MLEQQVSLASARAAFDRLVAATDPLTPERVPPSDRCRAPRDRVQPPEGALRAGARRRDRSTARSTSIASRHSTTTRPRSALETIPGIGRWTSTIYLLMVLGRPDVWPSRRHGARDCGRPRRRACRPGRTPTMLAMLGEAWRPWRSVAARLFWHDYLARRRTTPAVPMRARHAVVIPPGGAMRPDRPTVAYPLRRSRGPCCGPCQEETYQPDHPYRPPHPIRPPVSPDCGRDRFRAAHRDRPRPGADGDRAAAVRAGCARARPRTLGGAAPSGGIGGATASGEPAVVPEATGSLDTRHHDSGGQRARRHDTRWHRVGPRRRQAAPRVIQGRTRVVQRSPRRRRLQTPPRRTRRPRPRPEPRLPRRLRRRPRGDGGPDPQGDDRSDRASVDTSTDARPDAAAGAATRRHPTTPEPTPAPDECLIDLPILPPVCLP